MTEPMRALDWQRCLGFGVGLAIAAGVVAEPAPRRFDPDRLQRLDAAIEQAVGQERLAGAVMLIAQHGAPVHLQSYGLRDREARVPMTPDAIMRIASMSKAVTTVAALMLYEEGRFLLRDPIAHHLPAFRQPVVAVAGPGGTYTTEPARRPIRIIDLMCHTAGLTYGDGPARARYEEAGLTGWYLADKDETIAQVVDRLATLPLQGQPGEKYQYGYSTDVLGRLIEVVSGEPLDRFLARRIFEPLGMTDTSFFLPADKVDRFSPVYGYENGRLVLNESATENDYVRGPRKCFSGGAGLLSTALDYARFLQLLLNDGELDGVRLLAPNTVELMRTDHHVPGFDWDTKSFGLGFWVLADPGVHGEIGSRGSYGWGSAYYPQYLVDPQERMIALFMTQLRPTGDLQLNQRFKVLVYQALVD
jgi:CubicO group peptidase (beta-lactamase class C family)